MQIPLTQSPIQSQENTKQLAKDLIKHCNELRDMAIKSQPESNLKKFTKYYLGDYDAQDTANNITNQFNAIKRIVESKTTLVVDSQISTAVVPKIMSMVDPHNLEDINKIADVIDNSVKHVFNLNKMDILKTKVVRRGNITGIGIVKSIWNSELSDGIGDVEITEVNPLNFFPDPSATKLEDCNYIFLKTSYSAFTLKKRYPEMIQEIDALSKKSENTENKNNKNKDPNGILNIVGPNNNYQQVYTYGYQGLKGSKNDIVVWEAYMKDDSTFLPEKDDSQSEEEVKSKFAYPYGRVIIYAGEDTIFEDKPIDYPFGFPFDIFNPLDTDTIWGQGDAQDLCETQDRIGRAYMRLRSLIQEFISTIVYEAGCGINKNDIVNRFWLEMQHNSLAQGKEPRVLTNNTISEIKNIIQYIEMLKSDAMHIAGVNEMILTGERPEGVNSGQMVQDLNESPMASIRSLQRNYKEFLISLTNKVITLIQLYYNVERMVRISGGKQIARINSGDTIGIYDKNDLTNTVDEIKGDLTLGQYEVEVVAGSEMPRSKTSSAQLTMQLADKGYLGNPQDIEVKEMVLKALDFPNYRAIIEQMKETQQSASQQPPNVSSLIDKLATNFKDIPDYAKDYILNQLGIKAPPPIIPQVQPQTTLQNQIPIQ